MLVLFSLILLVVAANITDGFSAVWEGQSVYAKREAMMEKWMEAWITALDHLPTAEELRRQFFNLTEEARRRFPLPKTPLWIPPKQFNGGR